MEQVYNDIVVCVREERDGKASFITKGGCSNIGEKSGNEVKRGI